MTYVEIVKKLKSNKKPLIAFNIESWWNLGVLVDIKNCPLLEDNELITLRSNLGLYSSIKDLIFDPSHYARTYDSYKWEIQTPSEMCLTDIERKLKSYYEKDGKKLIWH